MKRQLSQWLAKYRKLGANCERLASERHTRTLASVKYVSSSAVARLFAVLTPISLIPQIARGCNEGDMDEAIAEKVNQMSKIVMASTADAWLIHLPGLTRRHEIFTAEQLEQDSANLDNLVTSLQDPEDDCPEGNKDHSLSHWGLQLCWHCGMSIKSHRTHFMCTCGIFYLAHGGHPGGCYIATNGRCIATNVRVC